MRRETALALACALLMGCSGSEGSAPSADASTVDAPSPDPAGSWSCDLLAWNPLTMMYGKSFGRDAVTVARTATGISWRMTLGGLIPDGITLDLVTRAPGWSLAMPRTLSTSAPDTGGTINSHDVSWRGDHLWAEEVGVASTLVGEREFRRAWDCARAP